MSPLGLGLVRGAWLVPRLSRASCPLPSAQQEEPTEPQGALGDGLAAADPAGFLGWSRGARERDPRGEGAVRVSTHWWGSSRADAGLTSLAQELG